MQIAAIGDIHGNLCALETVWAALESAGLADGLVLNAGDNVGYGPDPEGVVSFIRRHANILNVRGNYDKHVAAFESDPDCYRRRWAKSRPLKFDALRKDSGAISSGARSWLAALPREQTVIVESFRIILTHYSPGTKEGLGPWTSQARLEEIAGSANVDIVVCGHTHAPFVRQASGVLFVNPGTIGKAAPDRPAYAVIDLLQGRPPTAEIRQLAANCH